MHDARVIQQTTQDRRIFGLLWVASGVSNLADGVGLTAAPLLAAALTRDPLLVSGLTIAQRLPWFLFTLISGALVDRLDRRAVMGRSNLWRFILLALLAATVLTGRANLVILYVIFFLLGSIETLFDNAALAILPRIVEEEDLEGANGRLFATATVANELIGPPLGSYLFSILRSTSFFLASTAYGLSSLLIHRLPGEYSSYNGPHHSLLMEIKEGVRWFWRHRLLRTLGFFAATFNLVYGATMSVFVLFAQDMLGVNDAAYGFILAFGAVGGVLGSLLAKRLSDRFGAGWILFLDAVLSGLAFIGIGLTTQPVIVGFMFVLISMSDMFGNVIIISLRQAIIPPRLLGRVASAYRLVVLGALPLGAFIGGLLARTVNLATPFLAGGVLLAIAGITMQPALNNRAIRSARQNAKP
ncbi:MAG: MFS transporter [Anaerolineales bacterium]|jgi:predicted MFS family arabinose efflux permease